MLKILFITLLIVLPDTTVFANPRIYLVRHAQVDIKKPGWLDAEAAALYKEEYNQAAISAFQADKVRGKIKYVERIDTVFCSPQSRAVETASVLFRNGVVLTIDSVLVELDYPVIKIPVLQFPARGWLLVSRLTWMTGINSGNKISYRQRKKELEDFSAELTKFATRNGSAAVVAHGMVNRELVKILKNKGWHLCKGTRNSHKNLSVNCLEKEKNVKKQSDILHVSKY